MLSNGSTAIDGLSRLGGTSSEGGEAPTEGFVADTADTFQSAGSHATLNACVGRSMFFNIRLPRSSKVALSRPATASWDVPGDHDAAGGRFSLQPRRNVHPIPVEVVSIDDEIAKVKADPEYDP